MALVSVLEWIQDEVPYLIRGCHDIVDIADFQERKKVRIVVDFVFSIVDQLLTRSLGLE